MASHAKRVSAGNGDRCQACLVGLKNANDARPEGEKWTTGEIRQRRNFTRQKCAGCNLRICDACWGSSGELWDHEAKCSSWSDFASWPKKASIRAVSIQREQYPTVAGAAAHRHLPAYV